MPAFCGWFGRARACHTYARFARARALARALLRYTPPSFHITLCNAVRTTGSFAAFSPRHHFRSRSRACSHANGVLRAPAAHILILYLPAVLYAARACSPAPYWYVCRYYACAMPPPVPPALPHPTCSCHHPTMPRAYSLYLSPRVRAPPRMRTLRWRRFCMRAQRRHAHA